MGNSQDYKYKFKPVNNDSYHGKRSFTTHFKKPPRLWQNKGVYQTPTTVQKKTNLLFPGLLVIRKPIKLSILIDFTEI